jgi:phosphomannomutase/phosphoglucomutase
MPAKPNIPEIKLYCPDEQKASVVEQIKNHFLPLYECITLDGVRLQFTDGAWALVRYSNTSPYLTLHAEAPSESRLEEIKNLLFTEIRKYPEVKMPA